MYALTHRVNVILVTHHTCIHAEARNLGDWTPLHRASYQGHIDTVKYLVEEAKCNTGELIILFFLTGYKGHAFIYSWLV